ncbi:MAG: hypothetical protein LBS11_05900 [Oscillospiraceae bacterium]|jgi:hypothetical protein|nr:hypothetical protein [Oscillospiraceae bacterium]
MHPMLQVLAPPGLLYVNGRFCGETDGGGIPLARDGVVYVEYRPLDPYSSGAALRLSMRGGLLVDGVSGDAYAVQWPGGLLELEFRGGDAPEETVTHAQLKTPLGQLRLLERQGSLSVGYEESGDTVLPVAGPFSELSLRTQPHPTMPLVAVTGQGGEGAFTVMCRLNQPPEVLQTIQGRPIDWAFDVSAAVSPRLQAASPSQISREWLELTLAQDHSGAARLLSSGAYQQRFASSLGEYDQVVRLRYPVPGLAPVEWGALSLAAQRIARVSAVGFVGVTDGETWLIDRVIPYGGT